jgi:hypothetical protein
MAWTALTTPMFTVGQVVTAGNLNALSDNLRYLKGTDGPIMLDNRLTLPAVSGTTGIGMRFQTAGAVDIASFQGLDSAGTSFIFFGTNRQFDGSAWQSLNARAGGSLQIAQDAFVYGTCAAGVAAPTERFRVHSNGNVGINASNPQGRLHVIDTNGKWITATATGVVGSIVTVLPTGTITAGSAVMYFVRDDTTGLATSISAGVVPFQSNGLLVPIYSVAGDILNIGGSGSGDLYLVRGGGTHSYSAVLWVLYK